MKTNILILARAAFLVTVITLITLVASAVFAKDPSFTITTSESGPDGIMQLQTKSLSVGGGAKVASDDGGIGYGSLPCPSMPEIRVRVIPVEAPARWNPAVGDDFWMWGTNWVAQTRAWMLGAMYPTNPMTTLMGVRTFAGHRFEWNINLSSTVTSWHSQFGEAAMIQNTKGSQRYFATVISSREHKFSLRQLEYRQFSTGGALNSTQSMAAFDYSAVIVGQDFGPDNQPDTGDDVWYYSGSGSTLVNRIYLAGAGKNFVVNNQTDVNTVSNYVTTVVENYRVTGVWIVKDSPTGSGILSYGASTLQRLGNPVPAIGKTWVEWLPGGGRNIWCSFTQENTDTLTFLWRNRVTDPWTEWGMICPGQHFKVGEVAPDGTYTQAYGFYGAFAN